MRARRSTGCCARWTTARPATADEIAASASPARCAPPGVPATPDRVPGPGGRRPPRRSTPAGTYWAGRLTLCAGPDDLDRYDRAFAPYFAGRGLPRAAPREPPRAGDARTVAARRRAAGGAARPTRGPVRAATASEAEVLRHRDLAALTPAEQREARRLIAPAATRSVRRRRRHQPAHRGDARPGAHGARDAAPGGEPAGWSPAPARRPAAPAGAARRRQRLDAALRRPAAALRPRRRAGAARHRGLHRRHPAHPGHPGAAPPRPPTARSRPPAGGARLERRHPAGRAAEGVPRPVGPARLARGAVVVVSRRLGARRRRRCSARRWPGCPGSRTGWSGSTRTGAARLRADDSGDAGGAAARSTTSSPGTAWRASPSSLEVVAPCVTCCAS